MKVLHKISQKFDSCITFVSRSRARDVLLRFSDRSLEDAGVSRVLLKEGVKAWPWRTPSIEQTLPRWQRDLITIYELESFSEKDLNDLGIDKNKIRESITFGCEGIDQGSRQKVAL